GNCGLQYPPGGIGIASNHSYVAFLQYRWWQTRYYFTGLEGTMKHLIILFGLILAGLAVCAQTDEGASKSVKKEAIMTARGTFEVKVTPQPQDDSAGGPFGRLFLDKQFYGDLKATSKGQMLAARTAIEGSGGYVALELVTGVLNGKRGNFVLQHKGTMRKGVY